MFREYYSVTTLERMSCAYEQRRTDALALPGAAARASSARADGRQARLARNSAALLARRWPAAEHAPRIPISPPTPLPEAGDGDVRELLMVTKKAMTCALQRDRRARGARAQRSSAPELIV